jgi:putative ubiquitin-RnfH superfamily antitoxin RatB of RatAB toxin-antitoxin module
MSPSDPQPFIIEVIYSPPGSKAPWRCFITAEHPCTADKALVESSILLQFPEIDLASSHTIGIFGKIISLNTPLKDQDRLEIYRPLAQDPKSLRIKRAQDQAKSGKQPKQSKFSYYADA